MTTRPRIIWRRDPEFASAARAEHAFVEGYELVAFDIPLARSEADNRVGGLATEDQGPRLARRIRPSASGADGR